jgi:hypothetical protein
VIKEKWTANTTKVPFFGGRKGLKSMHVDVNLNRNNEI